MTKKEIWAKAQGILETNGVDNIEVYNELEKLLAPKNRVAEYFEPKLNENGEIVELWCNKHLKYEPVSEFAKKAKTKSGYDLMCKASAKKWWDFTKKYKEIEDKVNNIGNDIINGKMTIKDAKVKRAEWVEQIEEIKAERDTLPYN